MLFAVAESMSELPAVAVSALNVLALVNPPRALWNTPTDPLSDPYADSVAW